MAAVVAAGAKKAARKKAAGGAAGARRRPRAQGPDTSSGKATASDVRQLKAQARLRDNADPYKRAYEAGEAGEPIPEDLAGDPDLEAVHASGAEDARRQSAGSSASTPSTARGSGSGRGPGRGTRLANDGAGFLLGLVGYALLHNYLRGGVPQAKAWLSAKFLNRVATSDIAPPVAPATPARPSTPRRPTPPWAVDRGGRSGQVQR